MSDQVLPEHDKVYRDLLEWARCGESADTFSRWKAGLALISKKGDRGVGNYALVFCAALVVRLDDLEHQIKGLEARLMERQ